jgi:hypothetical protein
MYYKKYLKYKNKYIQLQKRISSGGAKITKLINNNYIRIDLEKKGFIALTNKDNYEYYKSQDNKEFEKVYYNTDQKYIIGEYGIGTVNIENLRDEKLKKYILDNNLPCKFNENFSKDEILVIAYDNNPYLSEIAGGSLYNFVLGLEHYNYNYIIIGNNQKWEGWTGRMMEYIKCLKLLPESQKLIMSDARDVLINNTYDDFKKKFEKYDGNNKIIFSTEVGCCVGPMWFFKPGDKFKKSTNTSLSFNYLKNTNYKHQGNKYIPDTVKSWINFFDKLITKPDLKDLKNLDWIFNYLNFGLHCGNCKLILDLYKLFDMQKGEDDQHLASEIFYLEKQEGNNKIILDYKQDMFSNSAFKHKLRKCTKDVFKNQYYNDKLMDKDDNLDTTYKSIYELKNDESGGLEVYKKDDNKIKFSYNDSKPTYPNFIQSPGKDWNCYNGVIDLLDYCDNCYYYQTIIDNGRWVHKSILKKKNYPKDKDVLDISKDKDVLEISNKFFEKFHKNNSIFKDFPINHIIDDIITPIYISLDLLIAKDIINIIYNYNNDTENKIKLTLNFGNLMGYERYKNHGVNHVMPWDDDLDLACFVEKEFTNTEFITLFKKIIEKNDYIITCYIKKKQNPYSDKWGDHEMYEFGHEDSPSLEDILNENNEVVLFNVNINEERYIKILNQYDIDLNTHVYYDSEKKSIVRPSVDMFFYVFNSHKEDTYSYRKVFGPGKISNFNKRYIDNLKKIKYNGVLEINVPENSTEYFTELYGSINTLYFKKHSSKIENHLEIYKKLSKYNMKYDDKMILFIVELYNKKIIYYYNILEKSFLKGDI